MDPRKDKKDMFNPKRLSFADTLSGNKRFDRLTLERELDEASGQVFLCMMLNYLYHLAVGLAG